MQYSPKLKKAMAEIRTILDENDIGGSVILHTSHKGRGNGEFHTKFDPSYSCFSLNPNGSLRLGTLLEEDFNGNKELQAETILDSFSFLDTLISNHKFLHSQLEGLRKHLEHLAKKEGLSVVKGDIGRISEQELNN